MAELEASESERVGALLTKMAEAEAERTIELIKERTKELKQRLADTVNKREEAQMRLFDLDAAERHQSSIRWFEQRLDQLERDRAERPKAVRARYRLKQLRIFPTGLLYLLPQSLVDERGRS